MSATLAFFIPAAALAKPAPKPTTAPAPLPTFDYAVRIPATDNTCDEEAIQLRQRFEAASGITALSATCRAKVALTADGTTYPLYSLAVSYAAESELLPYSSIYGRAPIMGTGASDGAYDSYQACLADLPAQLAFFGRTGLAAVASYCLPTGNDDQSQYALQIDGFGTPVQQLYVFNPDYLGTPASRTEAQVDDMLEADGATIALRSPRGIFYYADAPTALRHEQLANFDNQDSQVSRDQCEGQKADAEAIFAAAGSTHTLVLCLPLYDAMSLEAFHDAPAELNDDQGSSSSRYDSYDECISDRARAIAELVAKDIPILGGLCEPSLGSDSLYDLHLFRDDL